MTVIVLVAALICWASILRHWQRGIYMLVAYIPFAGVVTLLLYPSPLPTLFKDFLFVIPAYISFFLLPDESKRAAGIPLLVTVPIVALTTLVLVQMFNPGVANWMVAAIGAKVWLFYLPLMFLGRAMLTSRNELVRVFRVMVVIAWMPCVIGVSQWMGSNSFGYENTLEAFYGDAADQATQNFSGPGFEVGSFYRIPSTFVFVAQYFGYTLAMMVPAYALTAMDKSRNWRRFSALTFAVIVFAAFLSGARAAYLFVPILLVLCYMVDGRMKKLAAILLLGPPILVLALLAVNVDPSALYDMMTEVATQHTEDIVFGGLKEAFDAGLLGNGTGMNTGPARYAFGDPEGFIGIENYYAKAVYELGVLGLVVVVTLFGSLVIYGIKAVLDLTDRGLRSCAAAILAFIVTMMLNSFKGWQLDLDPINVYFWLFAGFLLKLAALTPKAKPANFAIRTPSPAAPPGLLASKEA